MTSSPFSDDARPDDACPAWAASRNSAARARARSRRFQLITALLQAFAALSPASP
jgi:hypothetical protein